MANPIYRLRTAVALSQCLFDQRLFGWPSVCACDARPARVLRGALQQRQFEHGDIEPIVRVAAELLLRGPLVRGRPRLVATTILKSTARLASLPVRVLQKTRVKSSLSVPCFPNATPGMFHASQEGRKGEFLSYSFLPEINNWYVLVS